MLDLPNAVEEIEVAPGLWLRVKVLTTADAMRQVRALHAALASAMAQKSDDAAPVAEDGPMAGRKLDIVLKSMDAAGDIAREAVFAIRQDPGDWQTCKIVKNPQDQDLTGAVAKVAIATLDQRAKGWALAAGGIAMRAAMEAADEVRPLSATAS